MSQVSTAFRLNPVKAFWENIFICAAKTQVVFVFEQNQSTMFIAPCLIAAPILLAMASGVPGGCHYIRQKIRF